MPRKFYLIANYFLLSLRLRINHLQSLTRHNIFLCYIWRSPDIGGPNVQDIAYQKSPIVYQISDVFKPYIRNNNIWRFRRTDNVAGTSFLPWVFFNLWLSMMRPMSSDSFEHYGQMTNIVVRWSDDVDLPLTYHHDQMASWSQPEHENMRTANPSDSPRQGAWRWPKKLNLEEKSRTQKCRLVGPCNVFTPDTLNELPAVAHHAISEESLIYPFLVGSDPFLCKTSKPQPDCCLNSTQSSGSLTYGDFVLPGCARGSHNLLISH